MQSIESYNDYTQAISHDFCIIKATAPWCGPCQKIHPKILELIPLHPHIQFYECNIDIDDCPIDDFIRVIPTFLFFQNSTLTHSITGADMLSINKYISNFQPPSSSDEEGSCSENEEGSCSENEDKNED